MSPKACRSCADKLVQCRSFLTHCVKVKHQLGTYVLRASSSRAFWLP